MEERNMKKATPAKKDLNDGKFNKWKTKISNRCSVHSISDSSVSSGSGSDSPPSNKRKKFIVSSKLCSGKDSIGCQSSSVPSPPPKKIPAVEISIRCSEDSETDDSLSSVSDRDSLSSCSGKDSMGCQSSSVPCPLPKIPAVEIGKSVSPQSQCFLPIHPENNNNGIFCSLFCCRCCLSNNESKKNPFIAKKLCVHNTCCCFIFLLFLFSLILVLALSGFFSNKITQHIDQRDVNLISRTKSLFETSLFEYNEVHFKSLVGYFYGSQFVDYEEFRDFVKYSEVTKYGFCDTISWYSTIPQKYAKIYQESIRINIFKLPEEDFRNLNSTQLLKEYNHIKTYAFPSDSKSIGETYDYGDKFTDMLLMRNYSSHNTEEFFYFRKLKFDGSYPIGEYHVPIFKSNLNHSFKGYQNGFLVYSVDLIEVFLNAIDTIYSSAVDITVAIIHSKGEKCIMNCAKYVERKFGSCAEHCSFDISFSDIDKGMIRFYLFNEEKNNPTPYDSQLVVSIVLPFFIALLLSIFACLSWLYIYSSIRADQQLSVFEKVIRSIALLDLDSKFVRKFISKRRPKRSEKILIRIISIIREFKTYLPTILINRIEGIVDSPKSEIIPSSSTCSNTSNIIDSSITNSSTTEIDILTRRRSSLEDKDSLSKIFGGIKTKNICILFVGVKNAEILRCAENYVELVDEFRNVVFSIVKRNVGNFHRFTGFSGFGMLFSFGAVSKRMTSSIDAVSSSWKILKNRKLKNAGISVCCGMGRTNSLCGDFPVYYEKDGTVGSKQFDFLNSGTNEQLTIEAIEGINKLNTLYETSILLDEEIYKEVKYEIGCKLVDCVMFKKNGNLVSEKIHKLYELVNFSKVLGDEWMYVIESSKTGNSECFEILEKCWDFIAGGALDEALKGITGFLGDEKNAEFEVHFKQILSVINRMKNGNSDFFSVIELV